MVRLSSLRNRSRPPTATPTHQWSGISRGCSEFKWREQLRQPRWEARGPSWPRSNFVINSGANSTFRIGMAATGAAQQAELYLTLAKQRARVPSPRGRCKGKGELAVDISVHHLGVEAGFRQALTDGFCQCHRAVLPGVPPSVACGTWREAAPRLLAPGCSPLGPLSQEDGVRPRINSGGFIGKWVSYRLVGYRSCSIKSQACSRDLLSATSPTRRMQFSFTAGDLSRRSKYLRTAAVL